jgi:hypothetical protein
MALDSALRSVPSGRSQKHPGSWGTGIRNAEERSASSAQSAYRARRAPLRTTPLLFRRLDTSPKVVVVTKPGFSCRGKAVDARDRRGMGWGRRQRDGPLELDQSRLEALHPGGCA